jgi:hypothetical protein
MGIIVNNKIQSESGIKERLLEVNKVREHYGRDISRNRIHSSSVKLLIRLCLSRIF